MTRPFSLLLVLVAGASAMGCGSSGAAVGSTPTTVAHHPAGAHPIRTEVVEYRDGATTLEGYLAVPTNLEAGKKPTAVLVFHNWMGVGPSAKRRTEQLAALGYIAFAADVYGKGVRASTPAEAGKLAGQYKGDRALMRTRVTASFKHLAADARVDASKIAAIGYCFGGTAALELARSGANLSGVVSFHGGLETPHPEDAKNIKAKILALHGADDPFVKPAEVAAFQEEMRAAKVDWQLVAYGGAVHAFSEMEAGSDVTKGAAYNAAADMRSWAEMRRFLEELK